MTDSASSTVAFSPRALVMGTAACALVLTLTFAHALAAYWQFYHLGSGGTGLFLIFFVLPGGLVVSGAVVFLLARARCDGARG